eukprot:TRINITY_DN20979_c0_g2_i1.p1 TRINITY_DN20979_c0_g2~~TRINITY_DN20979_c0_g2_i1.p1  ORF type:complete len:484 (+),score=24.60 TRINITY_DN20979_c0_g2_i1:104-1453(+)
MQTEDDLYRAFQQFGTIQRVKVLNKRSSDGRLLAFVKFELASQADAAVTAFASGSAVGEAPAGIKCRIAERKGSRTQAPQIVQHVHVVQGCLGCAACAAERGWPYNAPALSTQPVDYSCLACAQLAMQTQQVHTHHPSHSHDHLHSTHALHTHSSGPHLHHHPQHTSAPTLNPTPLATNPPHTIHPESCGIGGTTTHQHQHTHPQGRPRHGLPIGLQLAELPPGPNTTDTPVYPLIPKSFALGAKVGLGGSVIDPVARAEQKRAENNYPPNSRLFISFSKPLSSHTLYTVFERAASQIGMLENVYLVNGKNYGYAKYSNAEAAEAAIKVLNNRLVEGAACRVTLAEPQKETSPLSIPTRPNDGSAGKLSTNQDGQQHGNRRRQNHTSFVEAQHDIAQTTTTGLYNTNPVPAMEHLQLEEDCIPVLSAMMESAALDLPMDNLLVTQSKLP